VNIFFQREPGAFNSSSTTSMNNIILNHDFSEGIKPWRPIFCHAYVASSWSGFPQGFRGHFGDNYAVVSKRTQQWQGLEQDITEKVKTGVTYSVFVHLRIHGEIDEVAEVKAMIRLKNFDSTTNNLFVGR
jgi:Carbohydrate binding domain